MFCRNCGTELKPSDNFCLNCGQKVQDSEESVNNNEATNLSTAQKDVLSTTQATSQATSQASLSNNPTYNGPIGDVLSAKSWMIIGLIINIITLWFGAVCFIMFPTILKVLFILTVMSTWYGMNKVINLLLRMHSDEARYFYKIIKTLRLNYFICIFVSTNLITIAMLNPKYLKVLTLLFPILLLYYLGILVWALVQWINLIKFISKLTR